MASFRTAAGLLPGSAVLLSNLGNALAGAGDLDGARAACGRAVALDPALAEARVNLGRALYHSGEREAAIACCRQALALRPGSAAAHLQLGMALLAVGRFREGWAHYEHRLRLPGALGGWQPVQAGELRPLWDGAPMPGRTLLVVAEQGLGDTIQFARFLPLVRRLCGRMVLRAPRRLLALLDGVAELCPDDAPVPPYDAWCPLMSLPHRLGTTLETVPAAAPYLRADPARVERWRRALPEAVLRVGIAWQGNPATADDPGRSVPLGLFAPLASVPGVQLVSLQTGHGAGQMEEPALAGRVHRLGEGFDAGPDAFLDAAAVMAGLDLVVTTDTAIAHLAGALGPAGLGRAAAPCGVAVAGRPGGHALAPQPAAVPAGPGRGLGARVPAHGGRAWGVGRSARPGAINTARCTRRSGIRRQHCPRAHVAGRPSGPDHDPGGESRAHRRCGQAGQRAARTRDAAAGAGCRRAAVGTGRGA